MQKPTRMLIAWGIIIAIFVSCSADRNALQDGYYSAEAEESDIFGWKEFVTIRVSNGRVVFVEYDAYNPSGFIKSWDMNYMRFMNANFGTYPNAYTRQYARQFMENQGTEGLEAISGATSSFNQFLRLAETVLENARQGNTQTTLVDLTSR